MTAQAFFSGFDRWIASFGGLIAVLLLLIVAARLARLDRDTRLHALLMFAYFFVVIASFWMLKPVKKTLLLSHYADGMGLLGWQLSAAQVELVAKEVNMAVALLVALAFSLLARRWRRQAFAALVCVAFGGVYAVFAWVGDGGSAVGVWSFYLAGDAFVSAMVAAFFAFLNDSEDPLAARRLYGLIGLGGVLGGAFGSTVLAQQVNGLAVTEVAAWAALACGATLLLALAAGRIVARHVAPERPAAPTAPAPAPAHRLQEAFEGASLTFHSRYLMWVVVLVASYEMVSSLLDYQFTATVLHFVDRGQLGAYFTSVFAFTNLVAVGVQLLLTPWILKRLGVGAGLLLLPLLLGLCVAGFWIAPVLLIGSLLNTADNAFAYSINQSAKEILYVPLSRDGKYRAKAFIDIFVLRSAKALAVAMGLVVTTLAFGFENLHWLSLFTLALLGVWTVAAWRLAREYRHLEAGAIVLARRDGVADPARRARDSAWVPSVT